MAATVLAKDVLYRVSTQLTDAPSADDQFVRWTERELVDWLNDGQRIIAKYLPEACARVDAIKLVTGTKQSIESIASNSILPGDGSSAVAVKGKALLEVIRNMGANGSTPGRAISITKRDILDRYSPDWHSETDSEVKEYVFDPRTPKVFYVYPGVSPSATVWVEVAHLLNPTTVAYSADTMGMSGPSTTVISIDDQYVDELVNYILARGHMKDAESGGNASLAQIYISMFTGAINAQAKLMTGQNPNLRMLPMTAAPGGAS